MPDQARLNRTTRIFMLGAALMVAHLVAGKALRDGLFLSQFSPADLPRMVAAAAVLTVILGISFTRLLGRFEPARLVPAAFILGSLLHLAEYGFLQWGGEDWRKPLTVVIYLDLVALGAILLSGFWSVANEVFDPREARRRFGRIAGAGTIGGLAGGLVAERCAVWFGVESVLIPLAVLHLGSAAALWRSEKGRQDAGQRAVPGPVLSTALGTLARAPFLLYLAALVFLAAINTGLLDYLFKNAVSARFDKGVQLTRFFALFYTTTQLLSFAVQSLVTQRVIQKLGLGKTVMLHPAVIGAGAGGILLFPPFFMAPLARGIEHVFRGSFLRSGYEVFFTPIPAQEKRAVKTFIDVGCDRLGDLVGSVILQLVLALHEPAAVILPSLIMVLSAVGIWITLRIDRAYAGLLERGLAFRATALGQDLIEEPVQLSDLSHGEIMLRGEEEDDLPEAAPLSAASQSRLADLASGDLPRIQRALRPDFQFDPLLVPSAIQLLGWAPAREWARAYLLVNAHCIVGQLTDALLDPGQDPSVRRRLPQILAYSSSQRAVDGLMCALADERFELRFRASRALDYLRQETPSLKVDPEALLAVVQRELSVSRSVWQSREVLRKGVGGNNKYAFLDDVLKERADRSLEHLFSLLAVLLPRDPLKVAFRALHGSDRAFRNLALEYLEANLPGHTFRQLAVLVEAPEIPSRERHRPEEVVRELLSSQESILMQIKSPYFDAGGQGGKPPRAKPRSGPR